MHQHLVVHHTPEISLVNDHLQICFVWLEVAFRLHLRQTWTDTDSDSISLHIMATLLICMLVDSTTPTEHAASGRAPCKHVHRSLVCNLDLVVVCKCRRKKEEEKKKKDQAKILGKHKSRSKLSFKLG